MATTAARKACTECGKDFKPGGNRQATCGDACADERRRRMRAERRAAKPPSPPKAKPKAPPKAKPPAPAPKAKPPAPALKPTPAVDAQLVEALSGLSVTVAHMTQVTTSLLERVERLETAPAPASARGAVSAVSEDSSRFERFLGEMLTIERDRVREMRDQLAQRDKEVAEAKLQAMHHETIALATAGANEVKLEVVKQAAKVMDLVKLKMLGDKGGVARAFKPQGQQPRDPLGTGSEGRTAQDDGPGAGG